MGRYYRLHDLNQKGGAILTPKCELEKYNKQGYGIFWTPNDFNGERKINNLSRINYWIADIDEGEKVEQLERIDNLALLPSVIVETKKGFHCYWKAEDATIDNYKKIEEGIIKKLNADKHCKDPSRLLRVPGFYHLKDPKNPFMVKVVFKCKKTYSEKKMLFYFKDNTIIKKIKYDGDKKDFLDESKWDKIFKLNQISEGCRNGEFSRIAFWLRDEGFNKEIVLNTLERMNQKIKSPLDRQEIKTIVESKY